MINLVPWPKSVLFRDGHCVPGTYSATLDETLDELDDEGYRLKVRPGGMFLEARTPAGLAFGRQTVRQLAAEGRVPCLDIEDAPRLRWRGVLLDVARHFMPLEFLYRFVEQLAFHKLNVLHLHLTDDQGWRLEVDGFPRLTSVGGWRPESMVGRSGSSTFDGTPHGGFYTQEEMTGLARHAADLGVQIVPEIEMPGHARAALAAYRSLGVHGRDLPVWTSWGISEDVFGVHDEALDFCREVLRQVMKVFPGKYLHIGGDEVPTVQWESDPFSRERAAALGLAGPSELHGWFLGEMTRFVASHGRQAVCWEDASTLPRDAIVMAWRDGAGGADGEWPGPLGGTGHGHPVIMAPYRRTYLDYAQTDSPQEPLGQKGEIITLSDVYHFEPEPQGPVLGAQAQLWTEFAATPAEVEYLAYPRLCAFAEVAWGTSSYPSFLRRLPVHLDRLGVRHGEVPA